MAGRQSRGRQRIPMRRIEAHDDLYATFSKRRLGLYKKASELSTLCSVDVGMIIFSPTNNPFSFWHPCVETVVEHHVEPHVALDMQARFAEFDTRARVEYLNGRLDGLLDEKERLKTREKQIDEAEKAAGPEGGRRWEEIYVDGLDEEHVRKWKVWFKDLTSRVKVRLDEVAAAAAVEVGPGVYPSQDFSDQAGSSHQPVISTANNVMNNNMNMNMNMNMNNNNVYDPYVGNYYNVGPQAGSFGGGPSQILPDENYYRFQESSWQYNPMSATGAIFTNFSPNYGQDPSTGGVGEPMARWRNDNP